LPWDPVERQAGEVLDEVRYLAIRMRQRPGTLFQDGVLSKHFAVVTHRFDFDAQRLLEWQREKAGSIEALHDVLKNELAAGVMRLKIFCSPGKLIHHARRLLARGDGNRANCGSGPRRGPGCRRRPEPGSLRTDYRFSRTAFLLPLGSQFPAHSSTAGG
jgi:hypothetical protein